LEKEATNLKTSQFTGSDSIKTYVIQTTREWDWEYTTTFGGGSQETSHIYVKFIADHQNAPLAQPIMDILIDNNAHYRVGISEFGGVKSDNGIVTNGWVPDTYGNYSPTKQPNKRNELSWYNAITYYSNGKNVKVKFKVYATDTGRIIVG